ncbi:MAG: UvrD-helicase domain-containing protein, partial [Kiritimatiellae bacterium]|nr:UvrD-helicase domain-containing protein [Kiritimatiellia bacterium]
MNRNKLGHLAIAASAGSGKTFQLAHRYIRLLADGVTPDRIVALTFSRKAAGEMFDSVVKHLREAAAQDEAAAEAARRIGLPGVGRERFLGLLRVFTDNLQHVHISTLDSFIVGVARSFPMELGIPLDFVVAEDESPEAGSIREEVFARIFDSRNQSGNEREKLGEAFNQATSRRQEKRFHEVLSELVRSGRRYYRILPMASAWGDERTIWPQGMRWPALPGDPDALADKLVTSLSERTGNEKFIERWRALLGFLCHCARVGYWDNRRKPENALLEHALTEIAKLEAGSCVFRFYGKEYTLTRTECSQLFTLLGGVIGMEIRRRLEETRGTFKLLDLYEQHYQRVARERGSFTFGDVQVLLTGANTFSGGARLSRSPTGENRLYIDYRLNCRLDHWLIDEFQDTSDLQWAVLENLADEILQDTTGERSFFYVGDVKQAIYGWREGNRRLFSAILNRYGKRIETRPLSTSYRSCRAIVDTVNEIFGDISGDLLPEETLEEWAKVWQTHRCEEGRVPDDGVVMALAPLADDAAEAAEEKKEEEPCHRLIAVLLEEIKPLQRGLSAAILVRENKQAEEIVDFLRRRCPGLPVTHEGPAAITDNPVVRALLSLVKLGAHPEDFFAWRHLQMTPLALEFAKQGMTRRDVSLHVLRRIQSGGVRDLITDWGRRLERHQPLDEFGRQRLADLINVAAEFDLSGS